jgi:hypothetical protein
MIVGMFTIGGILFGDNDGDQTDYIRNDFLYHHGIKPKNNKSEHRYYY